MITLRPQSEFPYITEYRQNFPITDDTIFVFKDKIFSNLKEIPYDVVIHERTHLDQQFKIGAKKWIELYITDKEFRLKQELEAYREQLKEVRKTGDREEYAHILVECCRNISSPLYGKMITFQEALKIFQKN